MNKLHVFDNTMTLSSIRVSTLVRGFVASVGKALMVPVCK